MPFNAGQAVGYLDLDTSGFTGGFQTALASLKTFQKESATLSDKITAVGTAFTSAGSTLTKTVTVPLVGLGTAAVATTSKFEAAMSQVQATMGISSDAMAELDGASVNAMDALEDLAQELGAKTKFSAVEAAEAINYMALAGYDVQKTYGMLPNVLNLAAAGNIDLAYASDMVTDASSALGLTIDETSAMVDKMAKASSKSNTSVSQLGEAILTVGGTAKNLQGGTTELATALGILADNGIKGAEGGTALRNILLNLSPKSEAAAKAMEQLGFSAYDAEGEMRSLNDIFTDMASVLDSYSTKDRQQVLSNIFNKVDLKSVNAFLAAAGDELSVIATALDQSSIAWYEYAKAAGEGIEDADVINEVSEFLRRMTSNGIEAAQQIEVLQTEFGLTAEDAKTAFDAANAAIEGNINRWDELSGYIDDAKGAAQTMSETQLGNLSGQLTILKSSLEGMAIAFGELLLPLVKDVTAGIQSVVTWINNLDERQKATVVRVMEILAAIGPVLLILGSITKGIGSVINIISILKTAIPAVGTALSAIGGPVTAIIAIIGALVAAFIYLWNNCEGFREFWINLWDQIKEIAGIVVDALATFFTETIPGAIDSALEWIRGFVEDVKTFFTETIPEALGELVDWFAALPEKIGYAIGFAIGTIARWAVDLYNTVVEEVPKIIDKVVTFFAELPGKLWTWLLNTIQKIKDWVVEAVDTVKKKVPEIIDGILSFFSELPGKIWTWLTQVVDDIKTWVADMIARIKKLFPDVINSILDFFRDLPSQMLSIGTDLINGLWDGIKGAGKWIGDKAKSIGNGVIDGFKTAFDSHSPSKKMIAEGNNLMQGLSIGIDRGEGGVFYVLRDLFEQLFVRFDSLVTRLESMFSFDFLSFADDEAQDGLLRYNNILRTTLGIYREISDCLKVCVGYTQQLYNGPYSQVTALMSSVAQSIAIPRGVSKNPAAESNKNETIMISYLSQLLQFMKAASVKEPKQPITLIVQASGREMSRVVIDDINTLSRMTGGDVVR